MLIVIMLSVTNAECHLCGVSQISLYMLSVVMPNVIVLTVVAPPTGHAHPQ